ncbi:hypothetical protein VT71_12310 [Burkholderia mallei]|nr:hypothetical protein VT71_12310 [Burkholderia mallei]
MFAQLSENEGGDFPTGIPPPSRKTFVAKTYLKASLTSSPTFFGRGCRLVLLTFSFEFFVVLVLA